MSDTVTVTVAHHLGKVEAVAGSKGASPAQAVSLEG
jgi:hypothetical protein